MKEKIVEIIAYLMSELRNNTPLNEIDLTVLTNSGYTPTEISTAFSWLYEKVEVAENFSAEVSRRSIYSHRVLHEAERLVITPDAYGYLLQLREISQATRQSPSPKSSPSSPLCCWNRTTRTTPGAASC
jgi:uncharacterized protein Smg (DUF494 family)